MTLEIKIENGLCGRTSVKIKRGVVALHAWRQNLKVKLYLSGTSEIHEVEQSSRTTRSLLRFQQLGKRLTVSQFALGLFGFERGSRKSLLESDLAPPCCAVNPRLRRVLFTIQSAHSSNSHYLAKFFTMAEHKSPSPLLDINRNRLPTMFEVLSRRTLPPVDLFSFYIYMRDQQRSVDYLDFWYVA